MAKFSYIVHLGIVYRYGSDFSTEPLVVGFQVLPQTPNMNMKSSFAKPTHPPTHPKKREQHLHKHLILLASPSLFWTSCRKLDSSSLSPEPPELSAAAAGAWPGAWPPPPPLLTLPPPLSGALMTTVRVGEGEVARRRSPSYLVVAMLVLQLRRAI